MKFTACPLQKAYVVEPSLHSDTRGVFYRYYCKREFLEIGHDKEWVQLNHSFTIHPGTIRGMHYQLPPYTETKLVRCVAGKVWDVIVDMREGSGTFLQSFGLELSAENRQMIYIPEGFAHGFQTLSENCELIYHHSEYYTKEAEGGIRYDDALVNIKWPLPAVNVSERDLQHPLLTNHFTGIKI
jgi:dTDP-4-dehydrorhamnose 3,5-epimerase